VTNNEQAAAHRILQKHGIAHTLQGHRLPLTSNEFAIGIDGGWYQDFDDIRSYIAFKGQKHLYAADDLAEWRSDANAHKP
jgi:hypothetical protein